MAHLIPHWSGRAAASLSLAVPVLLVCRAGSKGRGWGSCHATSAGRWPGVGVMALAVAQPILGQGEVKVHSRGRSQLPSLEPRDSPGDHQGLCQPCSWGTRDLLPALG